MITLTEIMQQKDDVAFAEMLNQIRVKGNTDELKEALLSQIVTAPEFCPNDILHIFATNKHVHSHNSATLALLHSDGTSIDADDYKKDPHSGKMTRKGTPFIGGKNDLGDTRCCGRPNHDHRNIDVSQGLMNGLFATVLRIVIPEQHGFTYNTMLGLQMDDEMAGMSYQNRAPGGPGSSFIKRCIEFTLKDSIQMNYRKCLRTKIFTFIKPCSAHFYALFL